MPSFSSEFGRDLDLSLDLEVFFGFLVVVSAALFKIVHLGCLGGIGERQQPLRQECYILVSTACKQSEQDTITSKMM